MALGELYVSKGEAFDTAQQVLEVDNPMSCNVAMGCKNKCSYCYIPYIKKGEMRFPKKEPTYLVKDQICWDGIKPEGVFISFWTDPFLSENRNETYWLIDYLLAAKIRVATLSKVGYYNIFPGARNVRHGMTIVSLDEKFRKKFEPNARSLSERINLLKDAYKLGGYTWVSLEPYPTPSIWSQDLTVVLDEINFVDFIIFGKWNYDKRAKGVKSREFYREIIPEFQDYCKEHGIRHAIKTDTLKFIKK